MSLPHIILGLLQEKERTGYDLKTECFDDCIAHLWRADQAQIYRTLDKLEKQGEVACTVEIQHERPNRKVYRITARGQAELTRWLQTHQPLPVGREPLLMQLYFAAQLPDRAIVELLEEELKVRSEKLTRCETIKILSEGDLDVRARQMHQLVLALIRQREQTYINWLKDTLEIIGNSTAWKNETV